MPAGMSRAEEDRWVTEMLGRLDRRRDRVPRSDDALLARAESLARRHRLPQPASIRWADNQRSRWGSCTIDDRSVRLSTALAECPTWVLDYVIVHELAHLLEPGHSPRFWEIVNRYPRAERARGFLMAKELDAAS
ncbi:MAG: M48 family metallopeptidase [Actinobacteria bacterium]|nr:M48 family metallopeptidase [Actinomycetota bacterium]